MQVSYPEPLNQDHITEDFDCGDVNLNEFLKLHAYKNDRSGLSRTFVTTEGNKKVIGFYSLATGSIKKEEAPERVGKGCPRHPIPIILIARLAVEETRRREGIGGGLLKNALIRCLDISENVGFRAILVQAKNKKAASFYMDYGFEQFLTDPFHFYLLLKDIKKTVLD